MSAKGHFIRLGAALTAAAAMGAVIATPDIGERTARRIAASRTAPESLSARACATGEAPLAGGFAPLADVLGAVPLSPAAAPGEPPAAPHLRLLPRRAGDLTALAPARGEIIAIARRTAGDGDDGAPRIQWSVAFRPCGKILVVYDGLTSLEPGLLRRAEEALDGAASTRAPAVRLTAKKRMGEAIGSGPALDVGLFDLAAPAAAHAPAAPGRDLGGNAADTENLRRLLGADDARARCAFDYLPAALRASWAEKLTDGRGVRLPRGAGLCETQSARAASAALGAWFTDSSHNARADKLRAIALGDDPLDRGLLVLSLGGRLASLTPDFIDAADLDEAARRRLTDGILTATRRDGRINTPFEAVKDNETYCYEGLRAGFSGPRIAGVILLRIERGDGPALMRVEARSEALDCLSLPEPWTFSGRETSFFRRN